MSSTYTLQDLPKIAKQIINTVDHKILLFYGKMGVGKTTLIKEIVKQLGVEDNVSSPTFALVNEYRTKRNDTVFHFDFYRIKDEEEALDIGVEDYFYSNNWCLVEWPENVENLLPLDATEIRIEIANDQERKIQIKN